MDGRRLHRGRRGSGDGGGASASWGQPSPAKANDPSRRKQSNASPAPAATQATAAAKTTQNPVVVRNGYSYTLDTADRTTSVTGTLTLASGQQRSRSAQAGAGGSDRLATDDGGHYIAARFHGPTDTFNHFAQDANFNRGGYRVLEDKWAKDIKDGKQVYVSITPSYAGSSQRPSTINVAYSVNGERSLRQFPNSSRESPMANETGARLTEIGNILSRDTVYPLDGTFLYVEADWGWTDISIFKDLGASLLWRDPMDGLGEALLELWEAAPADKQWSSMQYRITGDRFDASFTYEPLDPDVSTIDRRAVILRQRYGNKLVVYPPLH